jgi:hypothetical protein
MERRGSLRLMIGALLGTVASPSTAARFVFRLDPDVIQRADVATVERTIERWLARAA